MNADDSLLFFYALEDKYGREHLHAALRHMVQARRLQTYEVQDLMAALEQETHQEVGSFFRLWLKHPGIPEEFRARYEAPAEPKTASEEGKK
jgi:aminopeptidase N